MLHALLNPEATDEDWIAARLEPEWVCDFLDWCVTRWRDELPERTGARWHHLAWDVMRHLPRDEAIERLRDVMLACDPDDDPKKFDAWIIKEMGEKFLKANFLHDPEHASEFDYWIAHSSDREWNQYDRLLITIIAEARDSGYIAPAELERIYAPIDEARRIAEEKIEAAIEQAAGWEARHAQRVAERKAMWAEHAEIERRSRLVRMSASATDAECEAADAREQSELAEWRARYDYLWPQASKADEMTVVQFPKPTQPRYLFETVGDLRNLPAAKWLVEKWIPEEGVGLIYGEYAGGKSFLLFDLLLHLAYGLPDWHGVKMPGEPCDVLLIAREGSKGFGERIDAFKAHHGITDDTDRLVFMRSPTNLGDPAQFEELKAAIAGSGRKFKVVAVDTVGRALPGEDFYDAKSITAFMERLQQLGEVGQGVAIGIHHVNKSGDAFGSVYFGASSDFMFLVEREGDGPLVRGRVTCTKMKDGEDGWKRRVDYQKAASSLVVASVTESGDMMGKAAKLSDDDKLACRALAEAIKAKGQLRPEMPGGRSVTIAEWLDHCFKIGGVDPTAAKPMRDLHRRQVKLLANRMILVQDNLVRVLHHAPTGGAISMVPPGLPLPPLPPTP